MEFSEVEQTTQDIDWFAVDETGSIGHFASAGKLLPKSVAGSKEDSERVRKFFRSLATDKTSAEVDSQVDEIVTFGDADSRNQYLQDFESMSSRGFYSYDSPLEGDRSIYFRVSSPKHPLNIVEIPEDVASIVRRTRFAGHYSDAKKVGDSDVV